MAENGLLIVVSGPSGAGKGTICKELLNRNPELNVSVSVTTRKPRNGEIDGVNYFFRSEEQFLDMIEKDGFFEYANVYGNYYGTPSKYVTQQLSKGKDIILEIDIQGALKVKEKYKEGIFIFIFPPSIDVLKERIIKRGTETEKDISKRIGCAYEELNKFNSYDYVVMNDELDKAVEIIQSIIIAEKSRVNRNKNLFKEITEVI